MPFTPLADLANNVVALIVVKIASEPPDREHPYGHQKFETLAVFGLAVLLAVLGRSRSSCAPSKAHDREVLENDWALAVMLGVLCVNAGLSYWERRWAKKLGSQILAADAQHTFADVLTTSAVIVGWQLSARGYALARHRVRAPSRVPGDVSRLRAFSSARFPDSSTASRTNRKRLPPRSNPLTAFGRSTACRSRWVGSKPAVDVVITVAPDMPTSEAHDVADAVEEALLTTLSIEDVTGPHRTRRPLTES